MLRASFSGELGYEINLPADHVQRLLERLWARAPEFAAVPYGIEALEIMRTEKGFIHIGTDTDGTTLPGDIGLARALERKAGEFRRAPILAAPRGARSRTLPAGRARAGRCTHAAAGGRADRGRTRRRPDPRDT